MATFNQPNTSRLVFLHENRRIIRKLINTLMRPTHYCAVLYHDVKLTKRICSVVRHITTGFDWLTLPQNSPQHDTKLSVFQISIWTLFIIRSNFNVGSKEISQVRECRWGLRPCRRRRLWSLLHHRWRRPSFLPCIQQEELSHHGETKF